MNTSNQTTLLEEIQTESSFHAGGHSAKTAPVLYSFETLSPSHSHSHRFSDFEKDSNFKLYKYVLYVYLIIIGFLLARTALQFNAGFNKICSVVVYALSFFIWFYGKQALSTRSSSSQKVFQGLLIIFMIYHIAICGRIILDSYVVMPNMTFSSFGLNAIFGILVPVAIYYEADKIRQMFDGVNLLALYKE